MRRIAGVNIRQSSLGACIADLRFRTMKPVRQEDMQLPADPAERNTAIAGVFQRWKKESGTTDLPGGPPGGLPEGIIIGLPLQGFSCQLIDMPSMGRADMRNALLFELEKYLPLPVEEYYFDFMTMPAEKGRTKAAVFALRKEAVDDIVRLSRDAGFEVLAVRSSFLSALRGLAEVHGEKNLNGLFVYAAGDAVEVAALTHAVPVYLKSFPINTELLVTMERLAARYPGRIFFSGSDDTFLGNRFALTKVHLRIPHLLAASAIKQTRFDFNFLSAEVQQGKLLAYYPQAVAGLASCALLFYLFTGFLIFYKDYTELKHVEEQRAAIRSRASGMLEAKKKLDLLGGDRQVLSDFLGRSTTAATVMSSLSALIPKEAWLVSLTIDDKGAIEIEGFTNRTAALILALEKSHLFRNVSYTAPIITKDGEERFALKLEVAVSDK
ncbi:MAG: hypothetical protein C0402_08085 [Thermodesulfovibrio sp.]|nr:hypothetical protein [Thermodesulfovibrio sp.]